MEMNVMETDVLVIGSGLAGVLAALKAAKMGCQVLLTSKVAVKSGNTIFAGGGWFVPRDRFTQEDYVRQVMEGGKHLNDPDLVRVLTEKTEKRSLAVEGHHEGEPGAKGEPRGLLSKRFPSDE